MSIGCDALHNPRNHLLFNPKKQWADRKVGDVVEFVE